MPSYQSGGAFQVGGDYKPTGTWDWSSATVINGNPTTATNVGAAATSVTASEYGNGTIHATVLSVLNLAMAISDSHVGGGTLVYTFPQGRISVLSAISTMAFTTTSVLASTLNASSTVSWGVGSVQTTTQDSGTLATTQQNLINATAATSSATVNVINTATNGVLSGQVTLDGTTTAIPAYLNLGIPTATDIDADATVVANGTVTLTWIFAGDY